jgi:hypothetical protein
MRVVKAALRAAGHVLAYSRSPHKAGYYLRGQGSVSPELAEVLRLSAAEVDEEQINILRSKTPAERFRLGCSVTDAARRAVIYHIRQQHPHLSEEQASYLALQGRMPDE